MSNTAQKEEKQSIHQKVAFLKDICILHFTKKQWLHELWDIKFSKAKYSSLMHMAIGSKSNVKFVYVGWSNAI